MAAQDYALPVRRAILPRLKGNAVITALVPAKSVYPGKAPPSRTFPFIRYGAPILSPFRASCLDSSSIRVTIHGFTKNLMNRDREVASAEDRAYLIGSAIKMALDGETIALEGGENVQLTWVGTVPRDDASEADAWATSVSFLAEVAG